MTEILGIRTQLFATSAEHSEAPWWSDSETKHDLLNLSGAAQDVRDINVSERRQTSIGVSVARG
jgi:hypothetical protein